MVHARRLPAGGGQHQWVQQREQSVPSQTCGCSSERLPHPFLEIVDGDENTKTQQQAGEMSTIIKKRSALGYPQWNAAREQIISSLFDKLDMKKH